MAISKDFAREIQELSTVQKVIRGFRYRACGIIGEAKSVKNPETGNVRHTVAIDSLGKSGLLDLETEEQVREYKEKAGEWCRVVGPLTRRSRADALRTKIDKLILPGMKEWIDPTDEEMMAGFQFDGFGKVVDKRFTEMRGETYRTLQVSTIGETFRFTDIDPELFEKLPESGFLVVVGVLESRLSNTQYGKENDLFLVLEEAKALPDGTVKPARPEPQGQPDPGKAA